MRHLRPKLSYANVVSTLCLFLVLAGGAAFAASELPKNSVGSEQIKRNAVTSAKVKNGSLRAADFAAGQLLKGDPGPRGATGPAGPAGSSLPPEPPSAPNAVVTWSKRVLSSAENNDPNAARAAAPEVALYQNGPLSIYGKCFRDADGDETYGEVFIKTSEDETIGSATVMGAHTGVSGGYIESSSPETALKLGQSKASSSFPSAYGDAFAPSGIDTFAVRAPDGTAINGSDMVGAKQETVPGGEGPYGPGDVCLFDGYAVAVG